MTCCTDLRPLPVRLWIYQAERFPLFKHGILIGAFASSAVCLSGLLSNRQDVPPPAAFAVAFAVLLGMFLLLRIADEFKDAECDARYRPERPVPRGLVSLRLLGTLGAVTVAVQALMTALYVPSLLLLLGLAWSYLLLMTKEFFIPQWLRGRPLIYMGSHMLIMPFIDLFATACEWWPAAAAPPGLPWFLALSFCNGMVIEIGRKTWAPEMERAGVDSYSSAWGIHRALLAWLGASASAFVLVLVVAGRIGFLLPSAAVTALVAAGMILTATQTARRPTRELARRMENCSGLWVFASYLMLGLVPMVLR
jgi:4-hydroxybenzoate polyprenyltransferase